LYRLQLLGFSWQDKGWRGLSLMAMHPTDTPKGKLYFWLGRVGWFVLLWGGGVLALGFVGGLIKLVL
ncbi:MAG: DUF2474 family protein, partial [Candidatus Puniceispirillum sp.]